MQVTVIEHPLVQHKVTLLRDKKTGPKEFRELVAEITMLLAYEVTRDFLLEDIDVQTPVAKAHGKRLVGKKVVVIPILRAGLGMTTGVLSLIPNAKVGHIGIYRDPQTLKPVSYYGKLPDRLAERDIIITDPMLATGGSATAAIDFIKHKGGKRIKLMCLVAAPVGVQFVNDQHPDVEIVTGSLDERLNDHGYIIPGLGDAGDRIFGTI